MKGVLLAKFQTWSVSLRPHSIRSLILTSDVCSLRLLFNLSCATTAARASNQTSFHGSRNKQATTTSIKPSSNMSSKLDYLSKYLEDPSEKRRKTRQRRKRKSHRNEKRKPRVSSSRMKTTICCWDTLQRRRGRTTAKEKMTMTRDP